MKLTNDYKTSRTRVHRYVRWSRELKFATINPTGSKSRLLNQYKVRTIRTSQAENRGIFKNSQLQRNFTDSYRKKSVEQLVYVLDIIPNHNLSKFIIFRFLSYKAACRLSNIQVLISAVFYRVF